jgi:dipeptidase
MNYSSFAGFPPPITNGGLNQHLVAARDVWSPSREELQKMTPNPQRGLNYSDLSRIVMERARTAREAVEIVGELINKHGYATSGGNSHLFADADEGWVLIEFVGPTTVAFPGQATSVTSRPTIKDILTTEARRI